MANKEQAVRAAASAFKAAVADAEAAGYRVNWRVPDLDAIEISSTGAVAAEKPAAPAGGRKGK